MNNTLRGYNEKLVTIATIENNISVGIPVKVSENTVAKGTTGDAFVGVVKSVRDGACAVQLDGYVELEYTGTAPSCGYQSLVCAGSGKVKLGGENDLAIYKVLTVDTTNKIVGFIL